MCSDENGAPHAVRYLNAQLAVLHENAKKCLEEHAQAHSEDNKHFWALAAFNVKNAGTSDYIFKAQFEKPELEFVCNHDAVLHITLVNGEMAEGCSCDLVPLPSKLRLTYRLGFETRNVADNDRKNGGTAGTIQLFVLNVKDAKLLRTSQSLKADKPKILLGHMKEYLKLLQKTGNNTLYSLPQFGEHAASIPIDFSLYSSVKTEYKLDSSTSPIHNQTAIDRVNAYFSSVWLRSVLVAHENANREVRCLARLDSSLLPECDQFTNFKADVEAPWVEVICKRELIVNFTISKIVFSLTGAKPVERKNWTKVITVDVDIDDTNVDKRFSVNLASGRHDHIASENLLLEDEDTLVRDVQHSFNECFTTKYLLIFHEELQYLINSVNAVESMRREWRKMKVPNKQGQSTSRDIVQHAKMFGFDQVVAISQGSINHQFESVQHSKELKDIFRKWSYQGDFGASFRPLTMCLMPQNRAIVWVDIEKGHCEVPVRDRKSGSHGAEKSSLSGWCLAFMVDLKMCSQTELEEVASVTCKTSSAYQQHGIYSDRELRHVYLDLHNAKYLQEYSWLGAELSNHTMCRTLLEKIKVVVKHISDITDSYFAAILQHAGHVIASIPVWNGGESLPPYAFTSVGFQVYSRDEDVQRRDRRPDAQRTFDEERILMMFGMTNCRPLVSKHLDYSTGWVFQRNGPAFSHGTISISKRVFVQNHLLPLLSKVTEETAFLPPILPDNLSECHSLKLRHWCREHDNTGKEFWSHLEHQGTPDADNTLRHEWRHRDTTMRQCEGNCQKIQLTVDCENSQYLELLRNSVNPGLLDLRLKIGGTTKLIIKSESIKADGPISTYQATCSVKWSGIIVFETALQASSVKPDLHMEEYSGPIFSEIVESGVRQNSLISSPKDMLQDAFPATINLNHARVHFDSDAFKDAWQYCYPLAAPYCLATPTFNDDGDLLFELRQRCITQPKSLHSEANGDHVGADPIASRSHSE